MIGAGRACFEEATGALLKSLLVAAFASVGVCGAAASHAAERDSVCVHLSGVVGREFVELSRRNAVSGNLPLSVCDVERGVHYRLVVRGTGFERRVGSLSIDRAGVPAVRGIQFSIVSRNVLPGWGSAWAGRIASGVADGLGVAACAAVLGGEELHYRDMRDRLDDLKAKIGAAVTYSDAARFEEAAHEASREINVENRYRQRLAILSGALYGWQMLEPFLWANPPHASMGSKRGEILLAGAGESRAKAFCFSLVKPGSGQFYQGKTVRGFFFAATTLAAGFVSLDCQKRYDLAVDDYEISIERFNAAVLRSDRERLRADASSLWSEVDRWNNRRKVSWAVIAGLWGWNLVDTMFPRAREAPDMASSFDFDGRRAWFALRF